MLPIGLNFSGLHRSILPVQSELQMKASELVLNIFISQGVFLPYIFNEYLSRQFCFNRII